MEGSSVTNNIITQASTQGNGGLADNRYLGAYTGKGVTLEAGNPSLFTREAHGDGLPGGAGGEAPASLLVSAYKSVTHARRRRRCFHRVISGLERGGCFRIMMLSSGVIDKVTIQKAWRSLRAWGKRRGLLIDYIRVPELTDTGYIHLHVIYRGKFIDRLLLMREWYRLLRGGEYLPGAKYVYLQRLHSRRGMAHYLAKYMAKGNELAGNYSWSWGWVWRGFVKDWRYLVHIWRCANHGWDEFANWRITLSYKWLLDRWRWHLAVGLPP